MDIDYYRLKTVDESYVPRNQKLSTKPSSTADGDIFTAHRLMLTEKPLTKTKSLLSQKCPWNLVLRLTLKSSEHTTIVDSKIIDENRVPGT